MKFLRKELNRNALLTDFALSLLDGVREHRAELDQVLAGKAENWSLERMAVVDRNILRLGAYEILYAGTPGQVAINEAVELAKQFGAQQSASFVNGILDRVMHQGRQGETRDAQDIDERVAPNRRTDWQSVLQESDAPRARGPRGPTMGFFDRFKSKPEPAAETKSEADAAAPEPAAAPSAPEGLLARFKRGLKRTAQLLNTDIRDLFKQEGRLVDEDFVRDLFALLIRTDMGTGPANAICDQVQSDYRGRVVNMDDVLQIIQAKLLELLAQPEQPIAFAESGPTVIMVVGVNGSGKTTSIAKLARMFRDQGKRVVLGAGDTFRAAAVEQLTIWAERVGAELVKGEPGGDPASVAHRAVALALESGAEVCIVDTAGRLQTQANLMSQLSKIRRVIGKLIPGGPARGAAGPGRHRGPERDQPGERLFRCCRLYGHRPGQAGWHRQRRRRHPHPPAIQYPGEIRGSWREGRGSGAVQSRRIRPRLVRERRRRIADSWTNRPRLTFALSTRSPTATKPVSVRRRWLQVKQGRELCHLQPRADETRQPVPLS